MSSPATPTSLYIDEPYAISFGSFQGKVDNFYNFIILHLSAIITLCEVIGYTIIERASLEVKAIIALITIPYFIADVLCYCQYKMKHNNMYRQAKMREQLYHDSISVSYTSIVHDLIVAARKQQEEHQQYQQQQQQQDNIHCIKCNEEIICPQHETNENNNNTLSTSSSTTTAVLSDTHLQNVLPRGLRREHTMTAFLSTNSEHRLRFWAL
eukprot:UN02063